MAKRRDKGQERRIARERVQNLFSMAHDASQGPDADLADRYATLARRIAMRYQIPLTPSQKTQMCRACGTYRVPGRNARVRLQRGRIVTTCLSCDTVRRRPLAPRA